MTEAEHQANRP